MGGLFTPEHATTSPGDGPLSGETGATTDREGQPPSSGRTFEFIDPAKVENAAKWATGGFALLGALLAFFGIKDGVLDRILRAEEDRVLVVFILIGAGVVASVLAPAFQKDLQIRAAGPCLIVAGLGVAAMAAGWEDAQGVRLAVAIVGFVVLAVVTVLLWTKWTSLVAAALVLGVVATSMGLYAAATLAMGSKSFDDDPRVLGTLEDSGGAEVVKVVARSSARDGEPLVVIVRGYADAQDADADEIGRAILTPDGGGEVDATQTFPVTSARWAMLTVGYCPDEACAQPRETTWLRSRRGEAQVLAAVSSSGGVAEATVLATDVAPGAVMRVRVAKGGQQRLRLLVADADGKVSWTARLGAARRGDVVVVRYAICARGRCGGATEIARHRVR